ncbi:hypothetical protein CFP56_036208 [Quercus suber]|uniref:Uncharacterized protein n=1 Tax=Quercus suber TaxID=58331 RepID=A0AAW0J821_QUESU
MGKASKWFRGLLGLNKKTDSHSRTPKPPKEKRRWSFVKSYREKDLHHHHHQTKHNNDQTTTKAEATSYEKVSASEHEEDANKHAIAVAAATAAAAEAAVAAAHAAAAVVRLTSSGRCATNSAVAYVSGGVREEWAALKIQAAFRGSLNLRLITLDFSLRFSLVTSSCNCKDLSFHKRKPMIPATSFRLYFILPHQIRLRKSQLSRESSFGSESESEANVFVISKSLIMILTPWEWGG